MIIPEDGCLPPITSSNLNAFNNIMIVKAGKGSGRTTGGTTFQLATLDRSKKGTIWPADNYVDKLIPGLPESKIFDEQKKEFESRKELNLSVKPLTVRPKLFQQPDKIRYHFIGNQKPHFQRKKNGPDGSDKFNKRFLSKAEIDKIEPWSQKPWENPALLPDPGMPNALLETPSINYNLPFPPQDCFYGSLPRGELDGVRHSLPITHPSSFPNPYPGYIRDLSPNFNPYMNKFDEMPLIGSANHYPTNNYRQNLRSGPNLNQHYKNNSRNASNRGSRHDLSTVYRNNFDPSFPHEPDYSGNDSKGKPLLISPNTHQKNYVPDSRHDPVHLNSFEDTAMENSAVYDDVGKMRNNSNNATYPAQRSRPRNRRQRNNRKFMHNVNPREDVNSLNPEINTNSILRANMVPSTPRDQWNSVPRFNYNNKNQKKSWMRNKTQNFKQSSYNVSQKQYKNFRGSNVRPSFVSSEKTVLPDEYC